MSLDRRQLILAAAAVIVLGLAVWTLWPASTPTPASAPPAKARARGGRANTPATGSGPVDPVKLAELAASAARHEPGGAGRNPFRFQPKVVAPPPQATRPAPQITPAPPPVMTGPPPPPPPQPIGLKFVGILQRANGVKWAVLTDGKSPTPMYGKDGDIIDGKYLIVKIGAESIEMAYTDGRGRQVIRLTGQ